MGNSHKEIENIISEDEESSYLGADGNVSQLDFNGLFSSRFSNIKLLYSSPGAPTELYTATRYGRRYILKGLKKQYIDDPIYNMALAKEFEIGILLDHPNIRRTLSIEAIDGLGRVIVLEYIDGCTLDSFLEANKLTIFYGRAIVEQIADALSYIHRKQIIHRDIKPTNILVSHNGNVVKLIDFNLSDSDEFIVLKNPAGSRKYMAPEQFTLSAQPSAATDIYSLGVVMSELAAMTGDEQLAYAAEKCINKNPGKRPQSVEKIKLPQSHPSFAQSLSEFLSSKILSYILLAVCISLSVFVVAIFLNR